VPLAVESASARLAQELSKKVRDRGLVLWVDAERQYEAFVDALGRKDFGFEYPVITFRGSYLELMLALEPFGNGLCPETRIRTAGSRAPALRLGGLRRAARGARQRAARVP
jgi:hypothetical protein